MQARTITLFITATNQRTTYTTDAATLGDFKSEADLNIETGLGIFTHPQKTMLVDDSSPLPEGDFTLIISTKKMKAGDDNYIVSEDTIDEIADEIDSIMTELLDLRERLDTVKDDLKTNLTQTEYEGLPGGDNNEDEDDESLNDFLKSL